MYHKNFKVVIQKKEAKQAKKHAGGDFFYIRIVIFNFS